MKNIILLIAFTLLAGCSGHIEKSIKVFAMDIINNPENIKEIKNKYPKYYSDSLIFYSMKDEIYINELYDYIMNEFNHIESGYNIFELGTHQGFLNMFKRSGYNKELIPSKFYILSICKEHDCLDFMFIKQNDTTYILFGIKKDYLGPID